jgi:hypothetical protein
MFSGLNLAFFSISKLRLEIEISKNNRHALKVMKLRRDSNFLLTTILWGNVGINVLLTLLSNSVMAGLIAFVFSTFVITFLGEIIPQAYFSRHALSMASLLAPVLRIYQVLLFPVAKPSALILDKWLGPESIQYFREGDFRKMFKLHMAANESDIEAVEGLGALNFLAMDDVPIIREGEPVDARSVIDIAFEAGKPLFPEIAPSCSDPFLVKVQASGKKWVILTDLQGEPKTAVDADGFLRSALFHGSAFQPHHFCHRPLVMREPDISLGQLISLLKVIPESDGDDVIDRDIILFWGEEKRIITGTDILGRLLRGIVQKAGPPDPHPGPSST